MKFFVITSLLLVQLLCGCATTVSEPATEHDSTHAVIVTPLDDGTTRVVLAADAAFQYGSIVLQPVVAAELLSRIDTLKQQAVVVAGYTDNVGAAAYNLTLSQQRAASVANELKRAGFDADQITVHGYGETHPVTSNETAAGRRANRRIELLFTPLF